MERMVKSEGDEKTQLEDLNNATNGDQMEEEKQDDVKMLFDKPTLRIAVKQQLQGVQRGHQGYFYQEFHIFKATHLDKIVL